jgi:2-oxoglutarate ferredoxin oxidoreductase subunit alpha
LGLPLEKVTSVLTKQFRAKGSNIVSNNITAAKAGYDYAEKNIQDNTFQAQLRVPKPELILNGNQAIALGAIAAGCKFYSAYPMSPSTSIMEFISAYAHNYNIIVEQAEDEIAAINMVIGASFAGARAMTSTSGGGFALMVEALSLAGMTEKPAVIVDAQRPGPATGFPTRTEQADLDFVLHAGHGEFGRIVFTPGTIEECFYLTIRAFNLADQYQIPVLIMTDQHLAESFRNILPFQKGSYEVISYLLPKPESAKLKNYQRYALTASGVSPRAVPSWVNGPVYADSDEHTEAGHITEDAELRKKMVEKRFYQRMKLLKKEITKPVTYNLLKARTVLVGFGSTHNVLLETIKNLKNEKIGFIHLPQVWPFPAAVLNKLLQGIKKVFTVENNAGAQLAGLIKRETDIQIAGSILKYDGRPFNVDELCRLIKERIKAK